MSSFVYLQRLRGVSGLRLYSIMLPSSDFLITHWLKNVQF